MCTLAVFGATGAQGAPVVAAALRAGHSVRALTRDPSAAREHHGRAVMAAADLRDLTTLERALDCVESAFAHIPLSYAPEERFQQLENLLVAARRTGLRLLVFSTTGHTPRRFGSSPVVETNARMAELVLASGVRAVVLAPTVYLENLHLAPLTPRLRSEGILDYPPLADDRAFSWTSQRDQATLAVAALDRPELAGRVYEIATPGAVTGPELAALLAPWAGQPVRYVATTPDEFRARLLALTGSEPAADAVAQLYRAIAVLPPDGATVDTVRLESTFGVVLPSVGDHIARWAGARESGIVASETEWAEQAHRSP